MSEEKLAELRRTLKSAAYIMAEAEEQYNKIITKIYDELYPPTFIKIAEGYLVDAIQQRRKDKLLKQNKKHQMLMVKHAKNLGEDPKKLFPHFEWDGGEPTGRFSYTEPGEDHE